FDRDSDKIRIVERNKNGERIFQEFPAKYVFYYDDKKGTYRSIYGNSVSKFVTSNSKEFYREVKIHSNQELYESDINPIFRCLSENYQNIDAPKLNVAFFDIEVDFDPEKGYSRPDDPFNAITAISIYLNWLNKCVTLVIPPKTLSWADAENITKEFPDTYLFDREEDLLDTFLGLIEDADILTGWNSEGYDIPYTVNRVTRILSKNDTRRFCLWEQLPKKRSFERFGAENLTFDLVGRVHMDYMQLYRKYTYEERHSYSLDSIGEHELNERKTQYEGTLDQLYNNDFKTFIDYNRQDTLLLKKLDEKLKFLDLANELAHANTVLLQTTMGAVAVTEQAIINEAHEQGLVVPNRKTRLTDEDTQAAGAYVAFPKKGIHDWIGSVDINSLYPSAIRALNMGNESIVGQLRPIMTDRMINEKMAKGTTFASAWEGLFASLEYTAVMEKDVGIEIIIDWSTGEESTHSAAQVWKMIFDNNKQWILSANGTIFSNEREAVVPGLLARWYKERRDLQEQLKQAKTKEEIEFWDKRQLVKKINLNSLYGAILNPGCRFFDKRIGQSTTLTGRTIAKHMNAHINECITGKYDHSGEAIIYGDTDSCYFSAYPMVKAEVEAGTMEWSKDLAVQMYDNVAESVNQSFTTFMQQAFHVSARQGDIIRGERELVAIRGLFITKKRYAVMIYDMSGKRFDVDGRPGKIKAMGLDLKRSDTPVVIQNFLSNILEDVLTGGEQATVIEKILQFKHDFKSRPGWEKGTPKRVNNLTKYGKEEQRLGKTNMPGHVRAALNWNNMRRMVSDKYSLQIVDGMKVIVCKLKQNPLQWTSIAYPTDEMHLPQWFKELPFADDEMESSIVDQKVENLLGGLGWGLTSAAQTANTF
ncbi:MAG: hypothetical protein H0Z55_06210, partial [Nitrosarchaeum sp.]|nr:hypothetical protein [Nitrosarchaeum sp.]